jgi:C-terminal processing protease CtpA/Prc
MMSFTCRFLSHESRNWIGSRWTLGLPLAALLGTTACGDGDARSLNCENLSDQIAYVDTAMRNYYLWNDELPEVDLTEYETPAQLLGALRYEDDHWSSIYVKSKIDAFYEGRSVGLGIRMVWAPGADGSDRLRISLVYEDSPAEAAGLERGMTILAFNGKTIEEIESEELWDTILGDDEAGVEVAVRVARVDGTELDVVVDKAELQRTSVSVTEVLPIDDMRVGYVMFEQFIEPSQAALSESFQQMAEEGVTDLVFDLRYNTGGLLDVTRYLASLIAGPDHVGETFLRFDYNKLRSRYNEIMEFGDYAEAIGFERVAFLVSGSTASASEALINGLRPYIDVHLVGSKTLGKPVGSNRFEFCDQVLQPITFALNNARGEGAYFDGIAPDCEMDDDLDYQLGDAREARLAAAISWLRGESCPADIAANDGGALAMPMSWQRPHHADPLLRGPGIAGYYGVF